MFEKEILPLLKKQNGSGDELLLVTPEKKEVVAISLKKKEYAEIYNRKLYSEVERCWRNSLRGSRSSTTSSGDTPRSTKLPSQRWSDSCFRFYGW